RDDRERPRRDREDVRLLQGQRVVRPYRSNRRQRRRVEGGRVCRGSARAFRDTRGRVRSLPENRLRRSEDRDFGRVRRRSCGGGCGRPRAEKGGRPMIRINLLGAARPAQVKKKPLTIPVGQKLTIGCSLIIVAAVLLIGWRYWALSQQSARLDAEIAAA